MKKLLFLCLCLIFSNFIYAQTPKYFWCSYLDKEYKTIYISHIRDITKISLYGVSRNGAYGKLSLKDYYQKIAKKWFIKNLSKFNNGKDYSTTYINIHILSNDARYNCNTGNEDGCFILNLDAIHQSWIDEYYQFQNDPGYSGRNVVSDEFLTILSE